MSLMARFPGASSCSKVKNPRAPTLNKHNKKEMKMDQYTIMYIQDVSVANDLK